MDKDIIIHQMLSIMDNLKIIFCMEKDNKKDRIIISKGHINSDLRKKDFSNILAILIKEAFKMMISKVKVYWWLHKENMMDNFTMDYNMAMDNLYGKMEANIEEDIKEGCVMEMGNTLILITKVYIGDFGIEEFYKGMVNSLNLEEL